MDKVMVPEEKIQKAFGIDFAEFYCQTLNLGKNDASRIKEVKPQAYKEILQLLEPFADKLLENSFDRLFEEKVKPFELRLEIIWDGDLGKDFGEEFIEATGIEWNYLAKSMKYAFLLWLIEKHPRLNFVKDLSKETASK
jgi:hypothetical protein